MTSVVSTSAEKAAAVMLLAFPKWAPSQLPQKPVDILPKPMVHLGAPCAIDESMHTIRGELLRNAIQDRVSAEKASSAYASDLFTSATKNRKRGRPPKDRSRQACLECGTTQTPQWRGGPQGGRTLCNACGLQWRERKAKEEKLAARGTTPATHSTATLPPAPKRARSQSPRTAVDRLSFVVPSANSSPAISTNTITIMPTFKPNRSTAFVTAAASLLPPPHSPTIAAPLAPSPPPLAPTPPVVHTGKISILDLLNPLPAA